MKRTYQQICSMTEEQLRALSKKSRRTAIRVLYSRAVSKHNKVTYIQTLQFSNQPKISRHIRKKRKHSRKYEDYLKSKHWKSFRKQVIKESGDQCEMCLIVLHRGLQVHHLHYLTLGNESRGDVKVLCRTCHSNLHAKY
jgi:hypothetical protein